jgi:CheY-like chemotaxis protein
MAKKIMVVDDDRDIVDYLVTLFKDSGYETCSAHDGDQALKMLETEKPDLVTQMPEFKETPVIVISGLSGIHLAIKKAVATINKPFDPAQVLGIVKDTIG